MKYSIVGTKLSSAPFFVLCTFGKLRYYNSICCHAKAQTNNQNQLNIKVNHFTRYPQCCFRTTTLTFRIAGKEYGNWIKSKTHTKKNIGHQIWWFAYPLMSHDEFAILAWAVWVTIIKTVLRFVYWVSTWAFGICMYNLIFQFSREEFYCSFLVQQFPLQ